MTLRGLMARIKPLLYRVLIILRVFLSILEETMERLKYEEKQ